jgi:hypothetical protein
LIDTTHTPPPVPLDSTFKSENFYALRSSHPKSSPGLNSLQQDTRRKAARKRYLKIGSLKIIVKAFLSAESDQEFFLFFNCKYEVD